MSNRSIGDYDATIDRINTVFKEVGIHPDELSQLDHLCYRTETMEEYHRAIKTFGLLGVSLGEVEVEGRPIAVVRLDEPIVSGGWTVDFLEVAAPKTSSPYPSGLEHAEFVTRGLLTDFEQRHQELPFKRDAMNRTVNPELKFREHGISVKFHQLNIGAVIRIEEALAKEAARQADVV